MSPVGPRLPSCAVHPIGGYLGYSASAANVVAKAGRDPEPTSVNSELVTPTRQVPPRRLGLKSTGRAGLDRQTAARLPPDSGQQREPSSERTRRIIRRIDVKAS